MLDPRAGNPPLLELPGLSGHVRGGRWSRTVEVVEDQVRDCRPVAQPALDLNYPPACVTAAQAGVTALAYAELYDEATGAWTRTNDMHLTRMSPGSALVADGRVLLAGGAAFQPSSAVSATVETFSPI